MKFLFRFLPSLFLRSAIAVPLSTSRPKAEKIFAVRMSYALAADFEQLSLEHGFSHCEIFLRAIALYKLAKENEMKGGNLLLRRSDGSLREVVRI
jgi:hypothetical protein